MVSGNLSTGPGVADVAQSQTVKVKARQPLWEGACMVLAEPGSS